MAKTNPRRLALANNNREKIEYENDFLIKLYSALVKPRMIEEKMLLLLRQGKISKWFSGIGQEAIAVGSTLALKPDEYILPLHRNLGVFTSRNVPLANLFCQFQGTSAGFTKSRDRSFHFGTNEYHIVGMISHLGPQLCVAGGIALAERLQNSGRVTLVYSGDGGTSEGDFHEALNVASVWDLPVIFIIENNGYALSTPTSEQFRCERLSDRAIGYGMYGVTIDGNNVLEVYETINRLAKEMRLKPRPAIVECMTFRMRGHEEASGVKYVPKELIDEWAAKDPVHTFETSLVNRAVLDKSKIAKIRDSFALEIEQALDFAFAQSQVVVDSATELKDVYRAHTHKKRAPKSSSSSKSRFIDAISDALRLAMREFPDLILMGQDIAEYGGVFKVTEGFVAEFGKERVRNTPLCESAIVGAGLGLSIRDMRSVIEMQFADFVSCGFNQIVNNLAKTHYRWGQNANVVIRMPTGGGAAAGPFHSQSNEAWFFHTPGLKVVYPAFAQDAKGLLLSAIEDPNPVIYFEHKALYRSTTQEVPNDYYNIELGKANLVHQGEDIAIITYGMAVHWALEVLQKNPDISASILDLRSLLPLDFEAITEVVKACGKVLVLHEDTLTGGIGAEVSAWISENCFEYLDAAPVRLGSLDTPVPFNSELEKNFFAKSRIETALRGLLAY